MAGPALEIPSIGDPFVISTLVILSGIASLALAIIGVQAFRRRRSLSYLLVAAALVVLSIKAFMGGLSVIGILSLGTHHVVEHGLDLLMALLLLGAIYAARSQHRCWAPGKTSGRL